MLFALWPGFAYSLSLDTSELVASAFVLGGLLALRHRRWAPAAALLVAAVLTRDTTAVVPFGVAAAGAWAWWSPGRADEPERPAGDGVAWLVVGSVPLVAFGAWQLLQRSRFGSLPLTSSGDNNLSAPLGGLADQLGQLLPPGGGDEAFRLVSAVGLVALLGAAAWCWRRSTAPLPERVAWLPAVAVVLLLNAYLWSGATAFMRAATEAGLLSILVILGFRVTPPPADGGPGPRRPVAAHRRGPALQARLRRRPGSAGAERTHNWSPSTVSTMAPREAAARSRWTSTKPSKSTKSSGEKSGVPGTDQPADANESRIACQNSSRVSSRSATRAVEVARKLAKPANPRAQPHAGDSHSTTGRCTSSPSTVQA